MNVGWLIVIGLILGAAAMAIKEGPAGVIEAMAYAIKTFEGWSPGSVSYRNNNPGNLKYAHQKGAVGIDPAGFAVFPTYEAGWQALCTQLEAAFAGTSQVYSPEDTLADFFSKYSEGDTTAYANYVAGKLGVSPGTQLKDIGHA